MDEFLARLRRIVPPGLLSQTLKAHQQTRPTTFRVNTLLAGEDAVLKDLRKSGLAVERIREFAAFVVTRGSFKKLTQSRSFEEGWIYLQSLSSQIPVQALDPQPGEKILDLAAAPGGKTTQMAALMQNRGEIVAVEPDRIRFERLSFNLKKQGVTIVRAICGRGEKMTQEFAGVFDRVLIDAPCSSEGTFCLRDRSTFAHWSVDFVVQMARLQKKLLMAALKAVKPGGTLVYSTCALSPEENEAVIDDVLQKFPEVTTAPVILKYPCLKPALPVWQSQTFSRPVAHARRIYPAEMWDGFFVCRMRKS